MTIRAWHDDSDRVVRVSTEEGRFEAYLARAAARRRPVVIVLHEVFGVNADMRATCEELASAGFTAICPELFWRKQHHIDLSVRSELDWEKGMALYMAFDIDAGVRDVEATVNTARSLIDTSGRVGLLGFCLGGLLAFLTAARVRIDAAVAFHGARTDEFLGEVVDVDAPLQMHLAGDDEFMPKAAQRSIAAALASNYKCELFNYPGCRHAFSRHGGIHFDADAARESRARTIEFFNRNLV